MHVKCQITMLYGLQGRDKGRGCLKATNNNEGHRRHRNKGAFTPKRYKEMCPRISPESPTPIPIPQITPNYSSMAEANPTPDLKTYKGNCHCGAFKFSIKIPELTSVTECNCSICFRKSYKWVFPGAGCFTIEKGDGGLKNYEFGERSMLHKVGSLS